jgi:hypothetical protein
MPLRYEGGATPTLVQCAYNAKCLDPEIRKASMYMILRAEFPWAHAINNTLFNEGNITFTCIIYIGLRKVKKSFGWAPGLNFASKHIII